MKKSLNISFRLYELFAIALTFIVIKAVPEFFGDTFRIIWYLCTIPTFLIISLPYWKKDLNIISFFYCLAILIGFFLHKLQGVKEAGVFAELIIRIVPILVIMHYKKGLICSNKIIRVFALTFFTIECIIAIYERITLSHLFDYESESQAMNVAMFLDEEFRSYALFGHPLWNANVVSLFLAFILCNNRISNCYKLFLMFLGLGAIWAFNSRACMLIWILIIIYRILFYGRSLKWILCCMAIIISLIPSLIIYAQNSTGLGRLDFDFSDSSSLTRILAFEVFLDYPWSLNDIIWGGTRLTYPATLDGIVDDPPLENGILMDLGYWGFILGPIKILGEVLISYLSLFQFALKDKMIIMIALWGVALMNNNSFGTFLMVTFMCAYLAFGLNNNQISPKRI